MLGQLGAIAGIALSLSSGAQAQPPTFKEIQRGPAGGALWQGVIPDRSLLQMRRPTLVYLPRRAKWPARYPVVYLLQGFPGSPYEYADGLRLPEVADRAIASGRLPPFIAVIPPAGLDARHGDWTGGWEDYLIHQVVPWTDAHLPTLPTGDGRTLAGLSAGGYGAVDIGLRHPLLFATLESWSGYFTPLRTGALLHADAATLAAHNPSVLARRLALLLRRLGTRFFLSSGTTHDRPTARATETFAAELTSLRLPRRLWLAPGGHNGRFWRAQLRAALDYALSPYTRPNAFRGHRSVASRGL